MTLTQAIAAHMDDVAFLPEVVGEGPEDRAQAEFLGALAVLMGQVHGLSRVTTQDAFEAGVERLATGRFLAELGELFQHPGATRVLTAARVAQLAPARKVGDGPAVELLEDLQERMHLVAAAPGGERLGAGGSAKGVAKVVVALLGLTMVGLNGAGWSSWAPGLFWTMGRRGLLEAATASGMTWEQVADATVTARDQRLAAEPFSQEASDRAATLLGLVG